MEIDKSTVPFQAAAPINGSRVSSVNVSGASENKSSLTKFRDLIKDARNTFKQGGFRGVVKKYGWKIFAIFFVYYLIRDVTLYILIPYLIVKGAR